MVTKFFANFCKRYRQHNISQQKPINFRYCWFIVSLVVAYVTTKYSTDNFTNSAFTVIGGFLSAKIIFAILFHVDNRKKYTKRFTGKLNFPVLKQIVKKMLFADSIFEIVSNVTRFFIPLE